MAQAKTLEPPARNHHGDQKAQRAPEPHTAITPGVERPTLADLIVDGVSEDAIAELQKISWTGNIREFRNVIERLIILCDQQITGEDVLRFAAPLK